MWYLLHSPSDSLTINFQPQIVQLSSVICTSTVEPSIADTIGTNNFVLCCEVLNSGASGIFPGGMVLRNQAVEHNVVTFQSFLLLYVGREG